ncbi:hypothetical protein [Nocardiopsis halophila]|uniref:hypothetical protein n=1 Tax=Nocardiopsis halophila TaxID=141692 RepID=UPI00034A192E|nr:hypothetical protein [Nocardiopsis halophila]
MDIPDGIIKAYKPLPPRLALYIIEMREGSEYAYMVWGVDTEGEHLEFEDAESYEGALEHLNEVYEDIREVEGTPEQDLVHPTEELTPQGLAALVATTSKATRDNPHGWLTGMEALAQWGTMGIPWSSPE